jgi:hypothetical protein
MRSAGSSRHDGVLFLMMEATKPTHLKRLLVVIVVGLHVDAPTLLAGELG